MATVAHCLYCFDALAANLEDRSPMALSAIEESWPDYPKGSDDGDSDAEATDDAEADPTIPDTLQLPTPSSLSATTPSSGSSSSTSLRSPTPLTPSSAGTSAPPSRASTSAPSPYHPIGQSISSRSAQSSALTSTPLFVTWNILTPPLQSRQLRGCIGTFEAQPLDTGLSTYALAAAHSDNRFNPIVARELPALEVAVTLLTNFETCAGPLDWELGVHGIKISFYQKGKRYSATYLPDVAVEQGWNKEETLESLVRKAGWRKGGGWRDVGELKVVRYQGRKESVEYEEYKRWSDWTVAQK
ncbi:hypothetical protein VE00_09670 [Pseudogymnoascus sp. WSF 3629]|nr:hypothetical protein VE00_09670 [Pseudogymnoascus sp. WSF 3629]